MRAHFSSIDGWVLLGAFFGGGGGVLLEVLVCKHCYLGSMLVYCCFFWDRILNFWRMPAHHTTRVAVMIYDPG